MENKRTRFITRIYALDRSGHNYQLCTWDNDNIESILEEEYKHYGLKIVDIKNITVTNIIWNYKIYYGSYKKKYNTLTSDDKRWNEIKKCVDEDLKIMGLEELRDELLISIKNNKPFEYQEKKDIQFKKYCVNE